ncbi:MAG: hypothetical protein J6N52_10750 [Clostridia bacterium]|nr:hypothetical protein [Clostridia bacterium]
MKKRNIIIICCVLGIAGFAAYIYAMLLPGLWYGDAFLYRQKDGSFAGSDYYADYLMKMSTEAEDTEILFSVNNKENKYIINDNVQDEVKIYKNNELIFSGQSVQLGDEYMLRDSSGDMDFDISVRAGNEPPKESELYPSNNQLYKWTLGKKEFRGNFYMLFLIIIFAAFLFLDIRFPMLFYYIRHGLYVDGGEPSDWYRFGQKTGRFVLGAGIIVCMILSFTLK